MPMVIIPVGTARLPSSKTLRKMTSKLIAFSGFGHTTLKAGPISDTMAFVIPVRDKTARCKLVLACVGEACRQNGIRGFTSGLS
jgi:hypothetical protein